MDYKLIKYNLLNGWNLFRFIRLAVGAFIIFEGVRTDMWMLFGIGVLFSFLALLNMGGCTAGNCAVLPKENTSSQKE